MSEEQVETTGAICPNCLKNAIRCENEITCTHCDAIFLITRKEGPKLKQIGPIEDLQDRVEKIEAHLLGQEPEQPAEPTAPEDGQEDQDEQPILPG